MWRWNRTAIFTLTVLTGINLFNYIDRFVMSALLTELEKPESMGGLGLDKLAQGKLNSAFIIVYALTSPVFGVLGDRFRRMWIIAGGVALWSVATGVSGFAGSMVALMVARACTGIGEAAYASITPSVISDVVPRDSRARALAVFNAAIPIGSALGIMMGGFIAKHYGWRNAFIVVGLPGLALAAWCVFLKEPVRGAMDTARMRVSAGWGGLMRNLARPAYSLPVIGYILQTAGFGALAVWAPSYLQQAKGMKLETATLDFGLVIVLTGFAGTIAGGWLGDRLLRKHPSGLMWVCGLSSVLSVPCILAMLYARSDLVMWSSIVLGCLLLVMSVGPVNAQIVNVLRPTERATGVAVCTTVIHLLGDAISTPVIGGLVDSMTNAGDPMPANMDYHIAWTRALLVVPAVIFLGGLVWMAGAIWGTRKEDA